MILEGKRVRPEIVPRYLLTCDYTSNNEIMFRSHQRGAALPRAWENELLTVLYVGCGKSGSAGEREGEERSIRGERGHLHPAREKHASTRILGLSPRYRAFNLAARESYHPLGKHELSTVHTE